MSKDEDRDPRPRPKVGSVEERQAPAVDVDGKKVRGVIPYGTESRDLGGFTEIIERGALDRANLDDLVATVEHAGLPLARYPTTLTLEDRSDGLHWALEPPQSRSDVLEAIERGDLKAGSWRMRVARDEWRGDVRHVHEIAELRDVSVVAAPSYEAAAVEFRSRPTSDAGDDRQEVNNNMSEDKKTEPVEDRSEPQAREAPEKKTEARVTSEPAPVLEVEQRSEGPKFRSLADEFRSRGFPGEKATISADEFRAATWAGTIDVLNQNRMSGVPLGADERYLWQVPPQVSVDAGVTSVEVFQQTSRSLAAGTATVRAIDATSAKPEVGSTLNVATVPMKQVAGIQSDIPNVYLERQELATVVENDLRLSINEGLDKLVLDAFAAGTAFEDPGSAPLPLAVRGAITTLRAAGYRPNTLVVDPASAEELDVLVSGITGGSADFVWGPGNFAGQLFGLTRVEAKSVPAPVVFDSTAHGKLYLSPISLTRWEQDAGSTNQSTLRLEGHSAYGTERSDAAVRLAGS